MKLNIQHFWEIVKADEETPESLKIKRQIILTATIPANIGTVILSVINVDMATTAVLLSTILLSAGLLIVNSMVLIDLLGQNKELVLKTNKLEDERNHYFDKSTIDELTQLKNRRDFMDTFKRYLSNYRQTDHFLCIAVIDIDFFKNYNDYYGHIAGDECLVKLGSVLKELQKSMKVYSARLGGEEFALLWFEEESNNVEKNALQIKQKIDELKIPHEKSEVSTYVTVSIGIYITECSVQKNKINELLNSADRALYEAKNNGRNQIVIDT